MHGRLRLTIPEILERVLPEPKVLMRIFGRANQTRYSLPCFSEDEASKLNSTVTIGNGSGGEARGSVATDGSVHRDNRENAAYLNLNEGSPKLNYNWDDNPNRRFGSASRGESLS